MRDRIIKFGTSVPFLDTLVYWSLRIYSKYKHNADYGDELSVQNNSNESARIWYFRISAPRNSALLNWGDYHFAKSLQTAFTKQNVNTKILLRGDKVSIAKNNIYLVIRGLMPAAPVKNATNVLWVISHPDQISVREIKKFDYIFAASPIWANHMEAISGKKIHTLLQATDADIFKIDNSKIRKNRTVFVGNSTKRIRKIVEDVKSLDFEVEIFGKGWRGKVPNKWIQSENLSSLEVADIYQTSRVVLNDHWPDMAANGFISNRIFDALACGATVVSDQVEGIAELFKNSVPTYQDKNTLTKVLHDSLVTDSEKDAVGIRQSQEIATFHTFQNRSQTLLEAVT